MRIWVVLPAFNEADNLAAIFAGLRRIVEETYRLEVRVLLVDDGSTDRTVHVAREAAAGLPVEILENKVNQGLAVTFMRGMTAAVDRAGDDDVVVCMDADNTHLPGQILRMVRDLQEGRDVVIASRYRAGAVVKGVPLHRRLLSRTMSILFQCIYPIPGVRDYSCGYRAYRAAFLRKALAAQGDRLFSREGFACMVGILLRLHKEQAICSEVPLVLRYDQKEGASKMRVGSTVFKTFGVLLRERFTR
jgi:dolichol-phosphate mannosyltransferase